jgi:hypothetical protein
MSFDYASLAVDVAELLGEMGAATTLTTTTPGTYDPNTGTVPAATTVAATVNAVVLPYADEAVNGTLIQASDQKAFVSAVGVTAPLPGAVLAWRGQALTVVRAKNLGPSGVFVLYELQVRAGG